MTIKYSSNDKLTEEDKISFKKLVEEIADISEMVSVDELLNSYFRAE